MERIPISIASKFGEDLLAQIGGQFGYLIYFDSNIETLKDELKKIDNKRDDLQKSVDAAKRNGEVIKREVESWLENVNTIFREAQDFEDKVNMKRRSLYGWCPNLKSRYSLSKTAKKITESARELQIEGGRFNNVSTPAPPQKIWSTLYTEGIKGFESRRTVMNGLLEALKNEEKRMIGICGMGGVGKTTMVKEIIKRLAGQKLFDDVVMVVVSQTPNIRLIQREIAETLGLKFVKETESGRAQDLHERIMTSERILIVLDDIWSELDFQAIGLPVGASHKRCKILLTSRSKEVCNTMCCQEIFATPLLTKEEAWEFFKETVGGSLDDPDLQTIAKLVANECGCLPIAIVTVAKALQCKRKHEWVTALEQLNKSLPENISGMHPKVYSSLKLSYDNLESDEVKSCFLLCCLFPEDYDIRLEYLVRYGWGQGIFGSIDTLEEARNRVHSFIDTLRRRFLLLDSDKTECIKMHDIIRDVAISIASKDTHSKFMVRCDVENKGWPEKAAQQHYTAISLSGVQIDEIPYGLEWPKLELLQLQHSDCLESSLFQRMKEVKVLSFLSMSYVPCFKESLGVLKNLHTLCLDDCRQLGDISSVGGLENLEILSFARSSIDELPREIGFLKQLRLLDTTDCTRLRKIPHGLLSSLIRLEELYMAESFVNWESAVEGKDESMASLHEVMTLSLSHHLKVLAIKIPDAKLLLKDQLHLKNQTRRFHISMSFHPSDMYGFRRPMHSYLFENCLMLCGYTREYMESETIRFLLNKTEVLDLTNIYYLKYVLNELDQEGFQHLKALKIYSAHSIEYLLDGTDWSSQHTAFPLLKSAILKKMDNLKAICHGVPPKSTFVNLRSLEIRHCKELKYAFSLSLTRNLEQLQSLIVDDCAKIEEIVLKERMEDENHESYRKAFPKLTKLEISNVPRLIGFYIAYQHNCKSEVTKISEDNFDKITESGNDPHEAQAATSSSTSKSVQVARSNILFPSICISGFQNLEKLVVEQVFKLDQLWTNVPCGVQGFQNLRFLEVRGCGRMKYVFSYLISTVLVNLQEVEISCCYKMETIIAVTEGDEEKETGGMILFPKLSVFNLTDMGNLVSLCPDAYTLVWSSMKSMHIDSCPKLKTLGSGIPQIKKSEAENLNANVVRESSSSAQEASHLNRSSSSTSVWCPGISCALLCSSNNNPVNESDDDPSTHNKSQQRSRSRSSSSSRASNANNYVHILPYPVVDKEAMATNLVDSNINDNLESLQVGYCKSLEVMFLLHKTHPVQAFSKLRELELKRLPKLMHIWEKGLQHITGFGNLRLLDVSDCGNLRYLFSPNVAKLLMSLEEIKVINCMVMEKIVGEAEGETTIEELAFPRVRSIKFKDLPNLECFCTQAYSLKWPPLMQVNVTGCPKLKPSVHFWG